jgi:hypothetical protein
MRNTVVLVFSTRGGMIAFRLVNKKLKRLETKRVPPTASRAIVVLYPHPWSAAKEKPTTRHAQPDMMSAKPRKSKVLLSARQVSLRDGLSLRE